jgi:hypothetical protein
MWQYSDARPYFLMDGERPRNGDQVSLLIKALAPLRSSGVTEVELAVSMGVVAELGGSQVGHAGLY